MFNRLDDLEMPILKNIFEQMIFEKDAIFQDMFDKGIKEEELFFLKNTRLEQIEIKDNTENNSTFFITNNETKTTIAVSNRTSTNNELRGQILKDRLTNSENSPTQTIYDLLTQNNPNIFTYELIIYLNNGLKGSYPLNFVQSVEYLIYEQIKNKTVRATFWDGVNFEAIFERANRLLPIVEYLANDTTQQSVDLHAIIKHANRLLPIVEDVVNDTPQLSVDLLANRLLPIAEDVVNDTPQLSVDLLTNRLLPIVEDVVNDTPPLSVDLHANRLSNFPFLETLKQLHAHINLLNAEGYLEESESLKNIHTRLIAEFVNLSEDTNKFKINCLDILNMKNYPELKVHHHLFKKVLSVLAQLFNFLSFGLIPQYKTESERMVISLFDGLNSTSLEPKTQSHLVSPV